jgi:SNF2 family DNA or RNA helicase
MLVIDDAPKAQAVKDLIETSIEAGKKVIVWFRFKPEIAALIQLCKEWSERAVVITGDTSADERELRIRVFNEPNDKRVLFLGQIKAGGIGTNLQAASHVIYYSSTFSLEDRLQSEDRAHRIGQRNDVLYDDVIMAGTIDKTILAAHRHKKNLADMVTGDNMRAAFNGELDV